MSILFFFFLKKNLIFISSNSLMKFNEYYKSILKGIFNYDLKEEFQLNLFRVFENNVTHWYSCGLEYCNF